MQLLNFIRAATMYSTIVRIAQQPMKNMPAYYLTKQNDTVSFWRDIGIDKQGDHLNVVVEIPKLMTAKLELMKTVPNHPLMQDTRISKGNGLIELRHYALNLPLINYGFIPQTWEQNITPDPDGYFGDNDPIDVCEIDFGCERQIGDIVRVKVLGGFCLIDEGELDWKVIVVDEEVAREKNIDSIADVPCKNIEEILQWYRVYKTYDGKPENTIGYEGKMFSKEEILEIVDHTHREFQLLLSPESGEQYQERRKVFHL